MADSIFVLHFLGMTFEDLFVHSSMPTILNWLLLCPVGIWFMCFRI